MVTKFSDDRNTISKGGNLGVIGISTFEKNFEDAAFGLQNDGDYSKPIETSIGYHIIKRISKPAPITYEKAKRKLQAQIKKDGRFEAAKLEMLEQIKIAAELNENEDIVRKHLIEFFYKNRKQKQKSTSALVLLRNLGLTKKTKFWHPLRRRQRLTGE